MTTTHTTIIIITICFIAIGTAFLFWDRSTPVKSIEEQKFELYKDCVKTNYVNYISIEDCNSIK